MQTLTNTAPAPDTAPDQATAQQAPSALAPITLTLPALQPGERYVGIALDDEGTPTHHLGLMAQRPADRLTWQDAMDWAASVGGALPTRQEQSLLFANCKAHLERTWHWSCEEYEGSASYAWDCDFDDGGQYGSHESYEGSVVAVRRFPLNSSIL